MLRCAEYVKNVGWNGDTLAAIDGWKLFVNSLIFNDQAVIPVCIVIVTTSLGSLIFIFY